MTQTHKCITIPFAPRAWQREGLKHMDNNRFCVLVAHRRAGKTEAVVNQLIKQALLLSRKHPAPYYAYIAPYLNQAKAVAWDRLKYYTRALPGTTINESEISVKLLNDATIRIFGADYPDRLRGLGFDGVVLDEVAQMRPETWPEIVRPCLADRSGWAVFIGTPKGQQNDFFKYYHYALTPEGKAAGWGAGMFTADDTGVIHPEELRALRVELGETLYAQEFLCDFSVSAENEFIDYQLINDACQREFTSLNLSSLVFGYDPARFGGDNNVLVRRRGLVMEGLDCWQGQDLMESSQKVSDAISVLSPQTVFVDGCGLGAGVVDRLKQLGHKNIINVNSGNKPGDSRKYFNLRAEMWGRMRNWLIEGGVLINDPRLKSDLNALRYSYDPQNRLKLEKKEDLKARGLPSPDHADALALTFAQKVIDRDLFVQRPTHAIMDDNNSNFNQRRISRPAYALM
jgi:hypothetical protein